MGRNVNSMDNPIELRLCHRMMGLGGDNSWEPVVCLSILKNECLEYVLEIYRIRIYYNISIYIDMYCVVKDRRHSYMLMDKSLVYLLFVITCAKSAVKFATYKYFKASVAKDSQLTIQLPSTFR